MICLRSARLERHTAQAVKRQKGTDMAIFWMSKIKFTGRTGGSSAVGHASYLERQKLRDERIGKTFRYTAKDKDQIVRLGSRLPDGTPIETQKLWNSAEFAEDKKDGSPKKNARTSRYIEAALPREFSLDQMKAVIEDFRSYMEKKYGVATTASIHFEDSGNPHLHFQWTTRKVTSAGKFGAKTRELDDRGTGNKEIRKMRYYWAECCNKFLPPEKHIDPRSYADLEQETGQKKTPQIHLGPTAARMKRKGEKSARVEEFEERERLREAEKLAQAEQRRLEELEAQIQQAKRQEEEREKQEDAALQAALYEKFAQMEAEENDARRAGREEQRSDQGAKAGNYPDRRLGENHQGEYLRNFGGDVGYAETANQEAGDQQQSGQNNGATAVDRLQVTDRRKLDRLELVKLGTALRKARDQADEAASTAPEQADTEALEAFASKFLQEIAQREAQKQKQRTFNRLQKQETQWKPQPPQPQREEPPQPAYSPMMRM